MPHYTPEEYAALLPRTYAPLCPRDNRPRTVTDAIGHGETCMEFILPHPEDGRFSVSLEARTYKGTVSEFTLFFGQVKVAKLLDPEEAMAAINEIIEDRIVAIVRYKNQNAYDNRRKAPEPSEWLYQLPDDEETLSRMTQRLRRPAGLIERLNKAYTGVFELYRWSCSQTFSR